MLWIEKRSLMSKKWNFSILNIKTNKLGLNPMDLHSIGIISNVLFQETIEIIDEIINIPELSETSISVNSELFDFLKLSKFLHLGKIKPLELAETFVDLIIPIGGDGTILKIARELLELGKEIPIFSINKGRRGFLTEIEPDNIKESIKTILTGKFYLKQHFLIDCYINKKFLGHSINEVMITSTDLFKAVDFQLIVDNTLISRSLADGLIVSTATGSTGHALSSGGAIIDRDLDIHEIVWINAITLSIRPIIIPADNKIQIRASTRINPIKLVIDGQENFEFSSPIEVNFTRSSKKISFIRLESFISKLRKKFHPEVRSED